MIIQKSSQQEEYVQANAIGYYIDPLENYKARAIVASDLCTHLGQVE